ncbi:tripartite tricarboxylate transporter substrate binding protein [Paenibacillus glucanolyticus]|uniref:tripartite tricarboxylate transporter substrate binding protein n=1 Tax=Paenibacillus glucanolyticus TaxID=59843 RepID=UPI0034CDC71E
MNTLIPKWKVVLISVILAIGLTACGSSNKTETSAHKTETAATSTSSEAQKSSYPKKAITITAPSGVGGGLDLTARALSKVLSQTKLVTQSITVENKPGGGQAVGLADFTQEKNNAYQLYLPSAPLIINNLRKEGHSPYSFRDLTPLAQLTTDYGAIVVKADSKYNDLATLLADLKNDPSSITLAGGSAPGSQDHLIAMLPAVKAGVDATKIKFISYDGGGEAITALLGGHVEVLSTDISGVTEYQKAGKVKVLGISAPARLTGQFADIPTYKEQGIDAEFTIWRGLFGSKDMPADAVEYWNAQLKTLSEKEEWKQQLQANGWENGYKNAADFQKFLEDQEKVIQELLTSLGMQK